MRRLRASPWLALGFLGVLGIFAASLVANFMAGWEFTKDPHLKWVFGGVSASVDVLKAMLVFAIFGSLARWRQGPHKVVAAALSTVLFLGCLGWSLRSATDFASASFSTVLAEREVKGGNLKSLIAERDGLQAGQAALLKLSASMSVSLKSRKEAADTHDTNAGRLVELRGEINRLVGHGEAVDEAYPLAKALGISNHDLARGTALFFALLLESISTFGFWCMARATDPVSTASSPAAEVLPSSGKNPPKPAPKLEIVTPKRMSADLDNLTALGPKPEKLDIIRRFFSECTMPAPGAATRFDLINKTYRQWCAQQGIDPTGSNIVGEVLRKELLYQSRRVGHEAKMTYLGVALRPRLAFSQQKAGGDSA